ncbi:hypothetical protein MRB53_005814 [Persea americana]|uniref:Uncharacterized protein n=1 Tax=Persea americana TaxID=3435 RepID=A0ACC2ME74_PERAE|nr:hypothetical protein MRB53_005814 [Persea americana]
MGRENTSSRRICAEEVSDSSSSVIDPLSEISCNVAEEEKVPAAAPANFLREGERREREKRKRRWMSENEICLILHFNGDLDIDHLNPIYIGGEQRIIFMDSNISYNAVVEQIITETNWDEEDEYPLIRYICHSNRIFTLVDLKGDGDMRSVLRLNRERTDLVLLYLYRSLEIIERTKKHTTRCSSRTSPRARTSCRIFTEVDNERVAPEAMVCSRRNNLPVMPSIQINLNRSSPFDDHQNETTRINGDEAQTISYGDGHESIFQEDCRSDPFNLIGLNRNMHLPQQPEIASVPQEIIRQPYVYHNLLSIVPYISLRVFNGSSI